MDDVNQRILQQRAKRLAQKSVQNDEIPLEMVLINVAGEQYALELTRLKAVMPADIAVLPLAPRTVAGIMNVRGEIVSVLDLAALLKFERDEKAVASVVLADTKYGSIGLRIDGVPELFSAYLSQLTPALAGRDAVQGVFNRRIKPEAVASKLNVSRLEVDQEYRISPVAWLDIDVLCGGLDL